jgi:hypothetical protein
VFTRAHHQHALPVRFQFRNWQLFSRPRNSALLYILKVHHRVHETILQDPILSQFNPLNTLTLFSFSNFNTVFLSISKPKGKRQFLDPRQNGRIILKWILRKYVVRVWWLNFLRIESHRTSWLSGEIQEVPGSNLGQETGSPDFLVVFLRSKFWDRTLN